MSDSIIHGYRSRHQEEPQLKISEHTMAFLIEDFAPALHAFETHGKAPAIRPSLATQSALDADFTAAGGNPTTVNWTALLSALGPILAQYGPELLAAIIAAIGGKTVPDPAAGAVFSKSENPRPG